MRLESSELRCFLRVWRACLCCFILHIKTQCLYNSTRQVWTLEHHSFLNSWLHFTMVIFYEYLIILASWLHSAVRFSFGKKEMWLCFEFEVSVVAVLKAGGFIFDKHQEKRYWDNNGGADQSWTLPKSILNQRSSSKCLSGSGAVTQTCVFLIKCADLNYLIIQCNRNSISKPPEKDYSQLWNVFYALCNTPATDILISEHWKP